MVRNPPPCRPEAEIDRATILAGPRPIKGDDLFAAPARGHPARAILVHNSARPTDPLFPRVAALHDRLEPAEPHPDQFPNSGLSFYPLVDHREPLRLVRAQRQNDPSSGFDLIEDR